MGNDIFFGRGKYDPSSEQGRRLIAHEVAHTVQQGDGASSSTESLDVSSPADGHEQEAHSFAEAFVRGEPAQVRPVQTGAVSRAMLSREANESDDAEIDAETRKQLEAALAPLAGLRSTITSARTAASTAFADSQASLHTIEQNLNVLDIYFDTAYVLHSSMLSMAAAEAKAKEDLAKAVFGSVLFTVGLVGPVLGELVGAMVISQFTSAVKLTQNVVQGCLIKVPGAAATGKGEGSSETGDLFQGGDTASVLASLDIGRAIADAAKDVVEIGAAADALADLVQGAGDAYIEIDQYARGFKKDAAGLSNAKKIASAVTSKTPDVGNLEASAAKVTGMAKGLSTIGSKLGDVVSSCPPDVLEGQMWSHWLASLNPKRPILTEDEHIMRTRVGSSIHNRRTGTRRPLPKESSSALDSPLLRTYLESRGFIGPEGTLVFSTEDTENDTIVAAARLRYFIGKTGEVTGPGAVIVNGLQLFANTGQMEPGTPVRVTNGSFGEETGDGGQIMHFTVERLPESDESSQ